MFVRNAHFTFRKQHPSAFDAPDFRLLQGDVRAWYVTPLGGKDAFHAGPRVRCTANDLVLTAVASVDPANAQAIRIGMLAGFQHKANNKTL